MNARNMWLITWEGTTNKITDENKIAGVLAARYSDAYIEKLVDFLYQRSVFSIQNMAYYANKRKDREREFKVLGTYPGHIIWGKNPFLFARRVKEFRVKCEDKNDQEIISWVEHAVIGNDKENNFRLKEFEPERGKIIIRKRHQTITNEP